MSDTTWKFEETSRGGKRVIHRNYIFRLNRRSKKGDTLYYKCEVAGCKTNVTIKNGIDFNITGKHNHATEEIKVGKNKYMIEFIKAALAEPTQSVQQIYERVRKEILESGLPGVSSNEMMTAMPTFEEAKSAIYRKRSKLVPPLPKSLSEINLNGIWTETKDQRPFLLDIDGNEKKIILFGTPNFIGIMCKEKTVYMDGTFRSAPSLFYQLYTLHVMQGSLMIPCIYALLPEKSAEIYTRMFRMIQNACDRNGYTFKPDIFQIDFESGMIRAIKQHFGPKAEIKACLFHYGQALWRKVQSLNLKEYYETNECFRRLFKRLCALPLCPFEQLTDAWILIHEQAPETQGVSDFLDYFVNTYIDEQKAIFHRMMWNHFDTIGPRTTNHLEGWHYAINKAIGNNCPTLFRTIKELQNQQEKFEIDLRLQKNGKKVRVKRKEYRDLDRRIDENKSRLLANQITILDYIDIIKYQLTSVK